MVAASLPSDIGKRLKALEDEVKALRKRAPLNNASISSGGLTVQGGGAVGVVGTGTIGVTDALGNIVQLLNTVTGHPAIQFIPFQEPTNFGIIGAVYDATINDVYLVFQSGTDFATDTAYTELVGTGNTMYFAAYAVGTGNHAGGGVTVDGSSASLGVYDGPGGAPTLNGGFVSATAVDNTVGVEGAAANTWFYFDGSSGVTKHTGKFLNFQIIDNLMGLYPGETAAQAAGGTSFALTYGATMASTMVPMVTLFDSSVVHAANVSSSATSGFTANWATAAGAGWRVFFWAYRV